MRIYLDMCCYNRQFDEKNSEKIILEADAIMHVRNEIRNKNLELATSFILHYENDKKINQDMKIAIEKFFKTNSKIYIGVDFSEKLSKLVKKIMQTGIKMNDAYHIASAILAECDYFLTVDYRLLKYHNDKIKIVNPIDFVEILRGEKNVERQRNYDARNENS